MLFWVNWIYVDEGGKVCYGAWNECEHTLKRAREGVEWLKASAENLVCAWVTRSDEQPDGGHKNTGTPYMEVFVDAFGKNAYQPMTVVDERGEPKYPVPVAVPLYKFRCPVCEQILGDGFRFCPNCGQAINWGDDAP